jgi:hypothetical protein
LREDLSSLLPVLHNRSSNAFFSVSNTTERNHRGTPPKIAKLARADSNHPLCWAEVGVARIAQRLIPALSGFLNSGKKLAIFGGRLSEALVV